MTYLLTNANALTALRSLALTQQELQATQKQISTGLRVGEASDDPAYFAAATTLQTDNGALASVKDALNLGASTLNVASSALTASISALNRIKTNLVSARQSGANQAALQTEISSLQAQLKSIATSASFSGLNYLNADPAATRSIVASFSRDASGNVTIGQITIDPAASGAIALFDSTGGNAGILDAVSTFVAGPPSSGTGFSVSNIDLTQVGTAGHTASIDDLVQQVDAALQKVTNAASVFGAAEARIGLQQTFISNLSDAITNGVSSLVDADMNQASTRLAALQTRQQLNVQSLSMANSNSQLILQLFK
ncbi:MAG: flagellin [Methylocystis sp.]|nr:flagellin [Methylocystis sp.]